MIWVGTSGYNYKEWKGSFYPENMPSSKMLPHYAGRFPTVEINYSFYRLPTDKAITGWVEATPDGFIFTLKVWRRITHQAQLHDCRDLLETFVERGRALGPKLGMVLFQLPPWLKKDLGVFDAFLHWLPTGVRAAFEFRNDSWLSDDVYSLMKAKNVALCVTDNERATTPIEMTADYGYYRLRDEGYGGADISRWAETIVENASGGRDAFVYFKHESEGKGPQFAQALLESLADG